MSISFPRNTILALCQKYGPLLQVRAPLDGPQLMAAIASNESTLGNNCNPRYEANYDVGGAYGEEPQMQSLLHQYGRDAACSFGPWQIMLINAPGYTPTELRTNPDACARAFLGYFNSFVIRDRKAQTLMQMGEVYNSGRIWPFPPKGVQDYCTDLLNAYNAIQFPEPL
jgi:hypothetical protein